MAKEPLLQDNGNDFSLKPLHTLHKKSVNQLVINQLNTARPKLKKFRAGVFAVRNSSVLSVRDMQISYKRNGSRHTSDTRVVEQLAELTVALLALPAVIEALKAV